MNVTEALKVADKSDVSCAGIEERDALNTLAAAYREAMTLRPMDSAPEIGVFIVKLEDGEFAMAKRVKISNGVMMLIEGKFYFDMPQPIGWLPLPTPINEGEL